MKSPFRNVGLRMRITLALATASAGTAVLVLIGVLWIIHGIVDRADERELRSHYDALQSRLVQESRRAGCDERGGRQPFPRCRRRCRATTARRCSAISARASPN